LCFCSIAAGTASTPPPPCASSLPPNLLPQSPTRPNAPRTPPQDSSHASRILAEQHAGADISEKYDLKAVIGRGSYAETRLCVERASGLHFAVKSIAKESLSADERRRVRREMQVLHALAGAAAAARGALACGCMRGRMAAARGACNSAVPTPTNPRSRTPNSIPHHPPQPAGHPNIVRLVDSYEDDASVHLVMELCSGGELLERLMERVRAPWGWFASI